MRGKGDIVWQNKTSIGPRHVQLWYLFGFRNSPEWAVLWKWPTLLIFSSSPTRECADDIIGSGHRPLDCFCLSPSPRLRTKFWPLRCPRRMCLRTGSCGDSVKRSICLFIINLVWWSFGITFRIRWYHDISWVFRCLLNKRGIDDWLEIGFVSFEWSFKSHSFLSVSG